MQKEERWEGETERRIDSFREEVVVKAIKPTRFGWLTVKFLK